MLAEAVRRSPDFKFQPLWVNDQVLLVRLPVLEPSPMVVYVMVPVSAAPSSGVQLHSYFTVLVDGAGMSFLQAIKKMEMISNQGVYLMS